MATELAKLGLSESEVKTKKRWRSESHLSYIENTSTAHFKLNKIIINHFKAFVGTPIIWIVENSIPFWADHHAATQRPRGSNLNVPATNTWS